MKLEEEYPDTYLRLTLWGKWAKGDYNKLYYPKCSAEQKVPSGGGKDVIPDNMEAEEIERILCGLKKEMHDSLQWKGAGQNPSLSFDKGLWIAALRQYFLFGNNLIMGSIYFGIDRGTYRKLLGNAIGYVEQQLKAGN